MKWRRRVFVALLLVALTTVGIVSTMIWTGSGPIDWVKGPHSEVAVEGFVAAVPPSRQDYARLMIYFVDGFLSYRTPEGSGADYPGWPSSYGRASDRLEGFSRSAPLMAAWLSAGRPSRVQLPSGGEVDLAQTIRDGVIAGTDPTSPGYWGTVTDRDQRIVEASDIALTLWLARDLTWRQFSPDQQARIGKWLAGVNGKQTADNNWHLFVVLVNLVLRDLGQPHDIAEATRRYARAKSFYAGDGWFRDGPEGRFDFYNAWGFHYSLYWIGEVAPDFDPVFLTESLDSFAFSLKHMVGPYGLPIMGRSVCYRLAAIAPLVMSAGHASKYVSPGEARRALDVTWQFFASHGALRRGSISQGYCDDDPRVLDSYSGPASCLWSLRSLVAAFYLPDRHDFWTGRATPLPIELEDFALDLDAPGWRVVGSKATGDIIVRNLAARADAAPALQPYTLLDRMRTFVEQRPNRPGNLAAKYESGVYGSRSPFCGCRSERPTPAAGARSASHP